MTDARAVLLGVLALLLGLGLGLELALLPWPGVMGG